MFPLRKRFYFALFAIPLFAPFLVAILSFLRDRTSFESLSDAAVILPMLFCLIVLTYPLGLLVTAASYFIVIELAWLPPFGGVLFLIPLYALVGYVQWYRLIPRYFKASK